MPRLFSYRSTMCNEMVSDATKFATELEAIESVAISRNSSKSVNGVLLVDLGLFVQVLEGDSDAIDEIMHSIYTDKRHTSVTVLLDEVVSKPMFEQWHMKVFMLDELSKVLQQEVSMLRDYCNNNRVDKGLEAVGWMRKLVTTQKPDSSDNFMS